MKLLIVGGAGYVGSILRPAIESEFECTHFDLRPVQGAEDRTIVADVSDDEKVRQAVAGVDAVLYMAMGIGKVTYKVNDIDTAFDVNVRGLYRFLQHSLSSGTTRFVYASTLSVYRHLGSDLPLHEGHPADAWETYGLSKRVGEFICQAATQEYPNSTVVAIRLNFPRNEADWPRHRYNPELPRNICALGPNDARRLFISAIRLDKPGFHMAQASGDMEDKSYPNKQAHEILGWKPNND